MSLKTSVTLITFLFIHLTFNELNAQNAINYLNSPSPPKDSLVVFAKGIVSVKNRWEEKICFTADGKEMFFGNHGNGRNDYFLPKLMQLNYLNDKWSEPKALNTYADRIVGWPILSADGNTLFLEEVIEKTENGVIGQIVFADKEGEKWSKLKSFSPEIQAKEGFGLGQITIDSTFYFHDRFDRIAYYSKNINGRWSKPTPLSYRINPCVEFFVSPQNDYFIFKPLNWSNQFHISFREGENKWSMPLPFSNYFKSKKGWNGQDGYGPYVSPDMKFFFVGRKGDIYWVKADFIEVLRRESKRP